MATITPEAKPEKVGRRKAAPQPAEPKEPKAPKEKAAPQPKVPSWAPAVKPSLVLLPPKARGLKARRQAARRATLMSLGLLGLTAGAYLVVAAGAAGAQAELNKEQAITASASSYLTQNRAVQEYADGYVQRKAAASTALEQDVAFSKVVGAIQGANTAGAVFTSMKTVAAGTGCVAPNPFAPSSSLGCLELDGKAPNVAAVTQLIAALNKDTTTLSDPYLTEATSGDGGVTFKINVGYTEKALSMKGQKFKPTDEELASIIPAPAAATQGATK